MQERESFPCSKCGYGYDKLDRYCGGCGALLPLPENVEGLTKRESVLDCSERNAKLAEGDETPAGKLLQFLGHSHAAEKKCGHRFCTSCGAKLS